jgi:hypothetical protein
MFVKLFENGYSPIPAYFKGKNPCINDWQKFCETKPTEEQIETWNKDLHKNKINIGVACGGAKNENKLVVIDIDTDDKEFLNKLPPSSVRRRGKKGEARFFRLPPDSLGLDSRAFPFLDILSNGRQVILPPSTHPEGMKYVWLTPDTLENTRIEELPILPNDFLDKITQYSKHTKVESTGRNNKLVDMVSAIRARGESDVLAAKEIYDWDLRFHSPRLFTDKSEGFLAKDETDAMNNAWRFVTSVSKSLIDKGLLKIQDVNTTLVVEINDDDEKKTIDLYKSKEYPEPTGVIKDVRDLIVDFSERKMPNIALGGAVALMAAVCSNRFRFQNCWSNMYVLNLAPTGTGKSFPQKIISMILDERLASSLIGFGNYQSSSAFSKNLISIRERFDVIDEISSLFAQMKSGGTWQAAILEEMCKVWSSSSGKYNAAEYAEKADTSSCFNPCINILGSSTIEGIKPYITSMMVTKGLIPRFNIFKDEDRKIKSKDKLNESLLDDVVKRIGAILSTDKRVRHDLKASVIGGPIFDPLDIQPTDKDAIEYFEYIKDDFFNRISDDIQESQKNMLTRGKEQTMKFAIGHAVGNSRRINLQDLQWAKQMFEVCLHNSQSFIGEAAVDTDWERDVEVMLNLFRKSAFVTDKLIGDRITRIKPQRRKELIEHLTISEKICRASRSHKGKEIKGWKLL